MIMILPDTHQHMNLVLRQVEVLVLFDDVPDVVCADAEGLSRHHPRPVARNAARRDGLLEPLSEGTHLNHACLHVCETVRMYVCMCAYMYVYMGR